MDNRWETVLISTIKIFLNASSFKFCLVFKQKSVSEVSQLGQTIFCGQTLTALFVLLLSHFR